MGKAGRPRGAAGLREKISTSVAPATLAWLKREAKSRPGNVGVGVIVDELVAPLLPKRRKPKPPAK